MLVTERAVLDASYQVAVSEGKAVKCICGVTQCQLHTLPLVRGDKMNFRFAHFLPTSGAFVDAHDVKVLDWWS